MRLRPLFLPAVVVAGVTALGGGVALAQVVVHDPPVQKMMSVEVNPAALAFWAGGNDPPEDESKAEAKIRWADAVKGAQVLATTGAALQAPERSRPGSWNKWAQMMVEVGHEGEAATKAKDAAKAFEIGGRVYDACNGCHKTYIPPPPRQAPLP